MAARVDSPTHVKFADAGEEELQVVGVAPLHQRQDGAGLLQAALQDGLEKVSGRSSDLKSMKLQNHIRSPQPHWFVA